MLPEPQITQLESKVQEKTNQQPVSEQVVEKPIEEIKSEESDKEINWKKFKEAREKERKESEEMSKRMREKEAEASALKAAMESLLNKPSHNNQDNDTEETEEQRIEKQVNNLLAKREAENDRKRAQREQEEFPDRLKSTFKDFNQVCTTENLDYLDYHYPEVASAFRSMPDSFDKWSNIYAAVKRFVPNIDRKKDMARAEQNLSKPQSMSKSGLSQSANPPSPTHLSEDRKAANWERMQRTLKGLS